MTLYSIPMRPKEPEYKAVEANSIKEAVAKAEEFWGNELMVVDICIECGERRAPNKVYCAKHFDGWYYNQMPQFTSK